MQAVALFGTNQGFKDKFFAVTDYIYYLGVGAILGVGSHFLAELDEVIRYDSEITYTAATKQLPEVSVNLQVAREVVAQGSRVIASADTGLMSRCLIEQSNLQKIRNKGDDTTYRLAGPNVPPGCEMILGTLDSWTRSTHDTRVLSVKKTQLKDIIDAGPSLSRSAELLSQDTIAWLLYKLFPALLLCGVTLKIGKTTNGLIK